MLFMRPVAKVSYTANEYMAVFPYTVIMCYSSLGTFVALQLSRVLYKTLLISLTSNESETLSDAPCTLAGPSVPWLRSGQVASITIETRSSRVSKSTL